MVAKWTLALIAGMYNNFDLLKNNNITVISLQFQELTSLAIIINKNYSVYTMIYRF